MNVPPNHQIGDGSVSGPASKLSVSALRLALLGFAISPQGPRPLHNVPRVLRSCFSVLFPLLVPDRPPTTIAAALLVTYTHSTIFDDDPTLELYQSFY